MKSGGGKWMKGAKKGLSPSSALATRVNILKIPAKRSGFKAFICGDLHVPYHAPKAVAATLDAARGFCPDTLVMGGDLVDFESISRFLVDPRHAATLDHELSLAKQTLRDFRGTAERAVFLEGNHEARLNKFLLRHAPQLLDLPGLNVQALLGLNRDWEYVPYPAYWRLGKLVCLHGESFGSNTNSKNLDKFGGLHVAQGHSHRLSQTYRRTIHGTVSAVEWGCLCDLNPRYTNRPNWQQAYVTYDGSLTTHLIKE